MAPTLRAQLSAEGRFSEDGARLTLDVRPAGMAGLCLGELLTEKLRREDSGRVLGREPVDAPLA